MKFGIQRAVEQGAKRTDLGDQFSWGRDSRGPDKSYLSFGYLACSRGRHSWKLRKPMDFSIGLGPGMYVYLYARMDISRLKDFKMI